MKPIVSARFRVVSGFLARWKNSGSHMWNKTEIKHCRPCSRKITVILFRFYAISVLFHVVRAANRRICSDHVALVMLKQKPRGFDLQCGVQKSVSIGDVHGRILLVKVALHWHGPPYPNIDPNINPAKSGRCMPTLNLFSVHSSDSNYRFRFSVGLLQ